MDEVCPPGRGPNRKPGIGNWAQVSEIEPKDRKLVEFRIRNKGSETERRVWKLNPEVGNYAQESETLPNLRNLEIPRVGTQGSVTRNRKSRFGNYARGFGNFDGEGSCGPDAP